MSNNFTNNIFFILVQIYIEASLNVNFFVENVKLNNIIV